MQNPNDATFKDAINQAEARITAIGAAVRALKSAATPQKEVIAEHVTQLLAAKADLAERLRERIEHLIREHFELTPYGITTSLDLLKPIYRPTAAYGHFGRPGFSWERTDKADALRVAAGI